MFRCFEKKKQKKTRDVNLIKDFNWEYNFYAIEYLCKVWCLLGDKCPASQVTPRSYHMYYICTRHKWRGITRRLVRQSRGINLVNKWLYTHLQHEIFCRFFSSKLDLVGSILQFRI